MPLIFQISARPTNLGINSSPDVIARAQGHVTRAKRRALTALNT